MQQCFKAIRWIENKKNPNWMGRLGLRTITHKKISSLDLKLHVYALSIRAKQWIARLDHLKCTLQQASMNKKMKMKKITQHLKIIIKIGGKSHCYRTSTYIQNNSINNN
jgi:hypothetical protein